MAAQVHRPAGHARPRHGPRLCAAAPGGRRGRRVGAGAGPLPGPGPRLPPPLPLRLRGDLGQGLGAAGEPRRRALRRSCDAVGKSSPQHKGGRAALPPPLPPAGGRCASGRGGGGGGQCGEGFGGATGSAAPGVRALSCLPDPPWAQCYGPDWRSLASVRGNESALVDAVVRPYPRELRLSQERPHAVTARRVRERHGSPPKRSSGSRFVFATSENEALGVGGEIRQTCAKHASVTTPPYEDARRNLPTIRATQAPPPILGPELGPNPGELWQHLFELGPHLATVADKKHGPKLGRHLRACCCKVRTPPKAKFGQTYWASIGHVRPSWARVRPNWATCLGRSLMDFGPTKTHHLLSV